MTKTENRFRIALVAVPLVMVLSACGNAPADEANAGAPAVKAEKLSVASVAQDAANTTPLASLVQIPGSTPLRYGSVKVNATVYNDSMYGAPCSSPLFPNVASWDMNRAYSKLTTTIGLDDNEVGNDATVSVTFKADGATVANVEAKAGAAETVEIGLDNVLRLDMEFTGGTGCFPGTQVGSKVVLGDAQLTPKAG